jgi:hypothetical protein
VSDRRARVPLNPDAERAANEAVEEHTGGRPLTMADEDEELRKRWMDAYESAGGDVEHTSARSQRDPTDPVVPCPKRLTTLELISLRFWSDYGLIKDEETKWTNTGKRYPVPEWVNGRDVASPIVHNLDKPVKLDLIFRAGPAGACAEKGTIEGTGPDGITFAADVTFKPGKQTFTLTSTQPTPKEVKEIAMAFAWSAKTELAAYSGTTANDCYLTMNKPVSEGQPEDGVTRNRARTAVKFVGETASLDPHTIVDKLMKKFPFYTLKRHPDVPAEHKHATYFNSTGGAWPMAEFVDKSGECQAIVRFVRGLLKQVGCPGEAKTYVVWSDPNVDAGNTVLEAEYPRKTLHDRRKTVEGVVWTAALADRDPVAVGTVFTPDTMGMNTFEACLRFRHDGTTKYYGGGAGVYDTYEKVIHAFHALVWFSWEYDDVGNTNYRIQEIVRRY